MYNLFSTDGSGGLTMDPTMFVVALLAGLISVAAGAASVWLLCISVRHFLNLMRSGSGSSPVKGVRPTQAEKRKWRDMGGTERDAPWN